MSIWQKLDKAFQREMAIEAMDITLSGEYVSLRNTPCLTIYQNVPRLLQAFGVSAWAICTLPEGLPWPGRVFSAFAGWALMKAGSYRIESRKYAMDMAFHGKHEPESYPKHLQMVAAARGAITLSDSMIDAHEKELTMRERVTYKVPASGDNTQCLIVLQLPSGGVYEQDARPLFESMGKADILYHYIAECVEEDINESDLPELLQALTETHESAKAERRKLIAFAEEQGLGPQFRHFVRELHSQRKKAYRPPLPR